MDFGSPYGIASFAVTNAQKNAKRIQLPVVLDQLLTTDKCTVARWGLLALLVTKFIQILATQNERTARAFYFELEK